MGHAGPARKTILSSCHSDKLGSNLLLEDKFLEGNHLHFCHIPGLIDVLWKLIGDEEQGQDFKIFLPNAAAFQQLGEQRCEQLNLKRNQDMAGKASLCEEKTIQTVQRNKRFIQNFL